MKNRIVEQWDKNKKNTILIWNLNARRNFIMNDDANGFKQETEN